MVRREDDDLGCCVSIEPRQIDVIGTPFTRLLLLLSSDRGNPYPIHIDWILLYQENGQQEVKRHMPVVTEMSTNGSFLVDMSSSFLLPFHHDGVFPSPD